MPSPRLSKTQREDLLDKLRNGHDLESAGSALGFNEGQIRAARDKYATEIATAFKTGTARLRARLMETALTDDNASVLLKLLEQREVQSVSEDRITCIERVIYAGRCKHCGQPSGLPETIKKPPESTQQDLNQPNRGKSSWLNKIHHRDRDRDLRNRLLHLVHLFSIKVRNIRSRNTPRMALADGEIGEIKDEARLAPRAACSTGCA